MATHKKVHYFARSLAELRMTTSAFCLTLFLIPFFPTQTAQAAPTLDPKLFPRPPKVQTQVAFWEKVFNTYPSHSVLIHDIDEPANIVDIIDFKVWSQRKSLSRQPLRKTREALVQAYLKRYSLALNRFQTFGKGALRYGAIEERLMNVYQRSPSQLLRLLQGKVQLRAQGGLADEFIEAAARAQNYLSFMENEFRQKGIPPIITRVAFVESMFNVEATSRVGASGVWQMMPKTAKTWLHINHLVDERQNPYKASKAAAALFAANYKELQAWPLAITAYNHGAYGLQRAVKQLGSADLGQIISSYQSPSFGFASRNFYAEFLAAAETYERLLQKNLVPTTIAPRVAAVALPKPFSLAKLLDYIPLGEQEFSNLNRCLRKSTYSQYRHQLLPKSYEIYLPKSIAAKVDLALGLTGAKKYATKK